MKYLSKEELLQKYCRLQLEKSYRFLYLPKSYSLDIVLRLNVSLRFVHVADQQILASRPKTTLPNPQVEIRLRRCTTEHGFSGPHLVAVEAQQLRSEDTPSLCHEMLPAKIRNWHASFLFRIPDCARIIGPNCTTMETSRFCRHFQHRA